MSIHEKKKRIILIAFRILKNINQHYIAQKLGVSLKTYQAMEKDNRKKLADDKKKILEDILEIPVKNIDDDSLGVNIHSHSGEHAYSATVMSQNSDMVEVLKSENTYLKEDIAFLKKEIEAKNKLIEQLLSN
jgi:transcriptional regulator with XRE-family HTH domain